MATNPRGYKPTHKRTDWYRVSTPCGQVVMRYQGKANTPIIVRCDENVAVFRLLDAQTSRGEIAKMLGVSHESIDRAIASMDASANTKNLRGGAAVKERERRGGIKRDTQPVPVEPLDPNFVAQVAAYSHEEWLSGRFQRDIMQRARAETADRVAQRKLPTPPGPAHTFVVCLNDFHMGEIATMTSGAVVWNNDIAARTLAHYTALVIQRVEMLSTMRRIDAVVLADVGDIIDGTGMFPGQEHHVEGEAPEQVRDAARAIAGMIYTIHHRTHLPVKLWWCPGNHDVAKFGKGRASEFGRSIVRETWRNCLLTGVDVPLARDPDAGDDGKPVSRDHGEITIVRDKTTGAVVVLKHAFPRNITTPTARNMMASWALLHGACCAISGHWHSTQIDEPHDGVLCVRSGSLVPGNAYGSAFGLSSAPSQAWLLLGPDRQGRPRVVEHGRIECLLDDVAARYRNATGYHVNEC